MSTAPLVTIGLPTYNGERYLEATLRSLLSQRDVDLELIVSINGSTDGTDDVCRKVAGDDPRVRIERVEQNRGAAWNYNRVLEVARGRYFKWAADDDVCAPTFLSTCVAELERSPEAVVAWPQTVLVGPDDETLEPLDDHDLDLRAPDPVARLDGLLSHRVEWHPVFGVVRTDALRRTRGIGAFVLADVAVLAELVLVGAFHQVPEPLFLRRYHEARSVAANPGFTDHAAWYDPSYRSSGKAVLPNARLVRELLVRVGEAPIPLTDRAKAAGVVLRRWGLPHWRHIGGEVKLAARARLTAGRARPRTAP